ncbi:hypothetical protein CDL12_00758 [Handroanthus impetiginosus]|uniref:Putative plant transposon protein domain-containing protein n=1 Tax=Handroanthus impetiginosus TaxID=429701 RepID=A0A2G9I9P4_9LAMI|nr:hypothetical protein CDL12_00758 [Handroanthus impetiginosus]
MVRGKNVNFSARTINSLFGTPSIDNPGEIQEFLEDHPKLETICSLICRENPQWTLSRLNEPIHFPRTTLTFAADNWLRFISARLLPSSHTYEVTRERAVMIYAILTDVPFDIGRFLHRSILKSAMGGLTMGLYHPSLVTELCARAGLERQPGDEMLPPDSMIRADRRPPRQPRPRQPPPAPGIEERVDRLADEVHQLQLQQEQHFSYQQQWWALWADQMNIPMSSRPHYPPDDPSEPPPADMGDE